MRRRILRFRIGFLSLLLTPPALFGQMGIESQQTADTVMLSGAISPRVRHADDRGPIEPARALSHMTLVFKRSAEQRADLNRLLVELQDTSSPNYHKWLTPEEFGGHFGASPENLQEAADWLRSQGFRVESTARGRGWIVFSGTVAQVQSAFHTEIHRYQVGVKAHFAPAAAPFIPARFEKSVSTIRGLDDFYLEPSKRPVPQFTGTDGSHALAPGDLARIYDFQPGGGGQTIAVIGESDVDLTDLRLFRSTFQLPPNDPQTILAGDDPGTDTNGAVLEADADLEWASAVAPDATIEYAYATDAFVAAQYAIDQNLAPILTFSFLECEPNISQGDATAIQDLAQQGNAQGITWIAASGDAGAAACDQGTSVATNGLAVAFPASLPEVTGVGGTEFNESPASWNTVNSPNLTSVFGYLPEVAWNDSALSMGLLASGGGASILFPKPSWQTGLGVPADGARDVPDLAFTASPTHDPYIVISGGKTYGAGGTSLAAPVFAGMLALVEPGEDGLPSSAFGNINPGIYVLASSPFANEYFHDILSGNNSVPCSVGTQDCANGTLGYNAGPGYDLVTGLGSIDVSLFTYPFPLETITTLMVSATQVAEGAPVTLTATVQDYTGTVPSGSVTFVDNGSSILNNGGTALGGSGTVSITALLEHGTHSIVAAFSPPFYGSRFAKSASAPVTVGVVPAPPNAPTLAAPANSATNVSVSVELTWSAVPFANSYDVYLGTTPSPSLWGNVSGTQSYPGALAPNTTYYWKVAARNGAGATASPVWSFTTTPLVYTISTIAGSSFPGVSPDNVPAATAYLSGPTDVALDSKGNIYVAEAGNNRVRMINKAGILSTVAGGGSGGDGGPATSASLSNPMGILIDSQGNLYISESPRVRMVSPAGVITTIAGGTTPGYSGDGGPAVNAQLSSPKGLALDSKGNLYIADGCVREVSAGIISTFAGQCPGGTGFTSGNPIGDGGPATSANLNAWGVAVDAADNVYIADVNNCRVREVSNGIITSVVGFANEVQGCGGGGTPVADFRPTRLAFDSSGVLYFVDGELNDYGATAGGRVVKMIVGSPNVIAGGFGPTGDGGPATSVAVIGPGGLAVDPTGKVYFTENYYDPYLPGDYSQRLRMLTPSSSYTLPAPVITSGGVQNSASFAPAPVAPGSIATIYGSFGFGSLAQASGAPLPTALTGLSIQVQSGISAPLFYTSAGAVTIQVPWELAGQASVPIRGVLNSDSGPSQTLLLAPFAPGIFTADSYGAVVNSSGQLLASDHPATAGDWIQIYCTGLGPVTNAPASGSAASSTTLSSTIERPIVKIGGVPAMVAFSGLSPGAVGEYQVNVQVPAGVTVGNDVPLVLSIGGVTSNTVMLALR